MIRVKEAGGYSRYQKTAVWTFLDHLRDHICYFTDNFPHWKIRNPIKIDEKPGRLYIDLEHDQGEFQIDLSYEIKDFTKDFNTVKVWVQTTVRAWQSDTPINLFIGSCGQEMPKGNLLKHIRETFKQIVSVIEHNYPNCVFQDDVTTVIPPDLKSTMDFYAPNDPGENRHIIKDSVEDITKAFEAASLSNVVIDALLVAYNAMDLIGKGQFKLPDDSEWEFIILIEFRYDLDKLPIAKILTTTVKLGDHFQQDIWTNREQALNPFDKDTIVQLVQAELDKVMETIKQEVSGYENDL